MNKTQGERLAFRLRQFPHTYAEMNALGISVCPQKRLSEWEARNPDWRIVRGVRLTTAGGKLVNLTTWAVKRAKPTAKLTGRAS